MPSGLPDDWVRVQVYMPEEFFYKLKMDDNLSSIKGYSNMIRKLIVAYLNLSESQRDSLFE